jgi:4-hydroxy-4-methyl-2-oxoglutarate aldolase
MNRVLRRKTLEALKAFDTCTISNAIEQFGVRLRNEGFMNASVRCLFPQLGSRIGYAVTGRIRTASTPVRGPCYYHRMDWWSYLLSIPAPRFVVLKDTDHVPGVGAMVGEVHANIFAALECTAFLTNGAVRDLPGVEATRLQVFAGSVAVSHSYAHVADFGEPVEVAGLLVKPGDLLHGDQHGVHLIPISIAEELPGMAEQIVAAEKSLTALCKSPDFSLERLSAEIDRLSQKFKAPGCPETRSEQQ